MAKVNAFAPRYYKNFRCYGAKCGRDCCSLWAVNVDKAAYDGYAAIKPAALRDGIIGNIKVTSEEPFAANMVLTQDGKCPFFRADRLCDLHAKRGHDSLPSMCRSYPRMFININGEPEAYLAMSCEAAVKAVLFGEEIIKPDKIRIDFDGNYDSILHTRKYTADARGLDVFWRLRNTSIYILQLRKYRLWLRMVVLGLFIQRADGVLSGGGVPGSGGIPSSGGVPSSGSVLDKINALSEEYIDNIENDRYDEYRDTIPDRHDIKISFIFGIWESVVNALQDNDPSAECFNRMKEGLGIRGGSQPMDDAIDNYTEVQRLHYTPYFLSREHILENYIVNAVLFTGFPFTNQIGSSVYENFVRLAIKFSLLKFLLTGLAGYHKDGFSQDHVIEGVTAFSRFFDHRGHIVDSVAESFRTNIGTDLGALCVLFKD